MIHTRMQSIQKIFILQFSFQKKIKINQNFMNSKLAFFCIASVEKIRCMNIHVTKFHFLSTQQITRWCEAKNFINTNKKNSHFNQIFITPKNHTVLEVRIRCASGTTFGFCYFFSKKEFGFCFFFCKKKENTHAAKDRRHNSGIFFAILLLSL